MSVVRITVPGNPVAWARARQRGSLYFVDRKTVAFKRLVASAGRDAMAGAESLDGPLALILHVRLPIPVSWPLHKRRSARQGSTRPTGRPDVDNYAKGVMDALNGICWHDDSQVVDLRCIKYYADEPCVTVEVSAV